MIRIIPSDHTCNIYFGNNKSSYSECKIDGGIFVENARYSIHEQDWWCASTLQYSIMLLRDDVVNNSTPLFLHTVLKEINKSRDARIFLYTPVYNKSTYMEFINFFTIG